MAACKRKVTAYIWDVDYEELLDASNKAGMSISAYIRRLIANDLTDSFLEKLYDTKGE